ncbi:DUF2637 domain-containing protein [Streptomyces flavofungini]|uniref:DUF2637 domain-containing protein n=1 Tax=Streptomyces flavofungini TaxID=68200 RepID=UPI0034DEBF34
MHETRGRHSRPEPPLEPLGPLEMHWDPAEELAHLLHEAVEDERNNVPPVVHDAEVSYGDTAYGDTAYGDMAYDNMPYGDEGADGSLAGLTKITSELPPLRPAPARRRSRGHSRARSRARGRGLGALRTTSFILAAFASVVVSMVCVFGGIVSYDPLRHLAMHRTSASAVGWWPLLVYGPWMVASLSILRAALHRRRAAHSWAVVLLFSTVSMLLCVAQAPRSPIEAAAAALPSLAALACFQQLVRQITLTRPPRQSQPRHRTQPPPSAPSKPA